MQSVSQEQQSAECFIGNMTLSGKEAELPGREPAFSVLSALCLSGEMVHPLNTKPSPFAVTAYDWGETTTQLKMWRVLFVSLGRKWRFLQVLHRNENCLATSENRDPKGMKGYAGCREQNRGKKPSSDLDWGGGSSWSESDVRWRPKGMEVSDFAHSSLAHKANERRLLPKGPHG